MNTADPKAYMISEVSIRSQTISPSPLHLAPVETKPPSSTLMEDGCLPMPV